MASTVRLINVDTATVAAPLIRFAQVIFDCPKEVKDTASLSLKRKAVGDAKVLGCDLGHRITLWARARFCVPITHMSHTRRITAGCCARNLQAAGRNASPPTHVAVRTSEAGGSLTSRRLISPCLHEASRTAQPALRLRRLHVAADPRSRVHAPRSDSRMCSASARAAAATSGDSSSPGASRFASTA